MRVVSSEVYDTKGLIPILRAPSRADSILFFGVEASYLGLAGDPMLCSPTTKE